MCKSTVDPNAKYDFTNFTWYKQEVSQGHIPDLPIFIEVVYINFFGMLRRMNIPEERKIVDMMLMGGALDIKKENGYLIIYNKHDNEVLYSHDAR